MSRMGGIHTGVKETRCENPDCKTPCQGFKAPDGKNLCADCLWKIWGIKPNESKNG